MEIKKSIEEKDPKEAQKGLDALEQTFKLRLEELYKKHQAEINDLFKEIDQKRIEQIKRNIIEE